MQKINVKPLSINEAFKGRRFKTPEYLVYEREVLLSLKFIKLRPGPYGLFIELGLSNKGADIDNPIKLISDILQKKFGFNDKDIYELYVKKKIVKKGEEYFYFSITYLQN